MTNSFYFGDRIQGNDRNDGDDKLYSSEDLDFIDGDCDSCILLQQSRSDDLFGCSGNDIS